MKQSQIKRIGRYKVRTIDVHAKEWFDKYNGNTFEWACVKELGWSDKSLWGHCQDSGIILRSQKDTDCLKREVIAWGSEL